MQQQHRLGFDDPDSLTRDAGLSVVKAIGSDVEPFDVNLFSEFTSMKALTYTASIRMIVSLLRDFSYEDFECVFGHQGILPSDLSDVLAFQSVVDAELSKAFVGVNTTDERRQALFDSVAAGTVRFFVVKDKIAHAKIYLLEREDLRRVIVVQPTCPRRRSRDARRKRLLFSTMTISHGALHGTIRGRRNVATSKLSLRIEPIRAEHIPVEQIPVLKEVEEGGQEVRIYVPADTPDEVEISLPSVLETVVKVAAPVRNALADMRPDRNGNVRITPRIVNQAIAISRSRKEENDGRPEVYLTYDGRDFDLSGKEFGMDVNPEDVKADAKRWIEFFANYQNGFKGDVPRLQRDYFTFMSWFYFLRFSATFAISPFAQATSALSSRCSPCFTVPVVAAKPALSRPS